MQYAVFHIQKVRGSGASRLGHHIDRHPSHRHTYRHADTSLSKLNLDLGVGNHPGKPLKEALEDRIKEGYRFPKAIRKDAVKGLNIVLSGSHEKMHEICQTETGKSAWILANYEFLKQEFGEANLVKLTLHLDEKTPHLHAVVVPLTADGRLSAKEIMGGPKEMSSRQTRYAKMMEPFGLKRGIEGSKAVHTSEGWYIGHQRKAQENALGEFMPKFKALDILRPGKYLDHAREGLKNAIKETTDLKLRDERRENQLEMAEYRVTQRDKTSEIREKKIAELEKGIDAYTKKDLGLSLNEYEKKTIHSFTQTKSNQIARDEIQAEKKQSRKERGFELGM